MSKTYYKTVKRDLKSWHGNVQYVVGERSSLVPTNRKPELCTDTVLHASSSPLDALKYASTLDCGLLEVSGDEVAHGDGKSGFYSLSVIREVPDCEKDALYGFSYNEAIHPFNPCSTSVKLAKKDIETLKQWDSVWDSVGASVRDSVWDSVGASVWDSVWASVGDSVWDSVGASVGDSVWASVGDSVWDSVGAYIGFLFPAIEKWKHVNHEKGKYPFQSGADLWKRGLIPVKSGRKWGLYHPIAGKPAELVWEGKF